MLRKGVSLNLFEATYNRTFRRCAQLGFKVFDDSNGGFRAFKSNYGNLLQLYIKEPWNRKSEEDYIRENAIFCIKERRDRKQ